MTSPAKGDDVAALLRQIRYCRAEARRLKRFRLEDILVLAMAEIDTMPPGRVSEPMSSRLARLLLVTADDEV
jgi:hypothetical protein